MRIILAMLLLPIATAIVAILPVRAAVEPTSAAGVASKSPDEEAIRRAAAAYRQALAKRDIDAIAAFWTPDADYVDQLGRVYKIQAGLALARQQSQEERHIAHLSPKMETLSIRSLTPDVAIEDGTFERAGAQSRTSTSRAVHGHVGKTKWQMVDRRRARVAGAGRHKLRATQKPGMDDRRLGRRESAARRRGVVRHGGPTKPTSSRS